MSLRLPRRSRVRRHQLELLERRSLLAGLVSAEFSNGVLQIVGDELDNRFTVEQVLGSNGRLAGIRIAPDAETQINDLEPGVPLVLNGGTLRAVKVSTGAGGDEVGFRDLSVRGILLADNSGGYDVLRIANTTVDGVLEVVSASSSDVAIEGATARGIFLKFGNIESENLATVGLTTNTRGKSSDSGDVGTDATSAGDAGDVAVTDVADRGSVLISRTRVNGDVRVESTAPLDFKGESSSARAGYLKIGDIKGESTDARHKSTIEIDSFNWGGSLRVDSLAPTDLSLTDSSVSGDTSLKYELSDVIVSSFSIAGSKLGGLRTESSTVVQGKIEDTKVSRNAAFHYLKIESTDADFQEQSSLHVDGLTIIGSLDLVTSQPLEFHGESSSARIGFLKYEPDSAVEQGAGHKNWTSLESFTLNGALRVESQVPLDLLANNLRVAGETYLKIKLSDVIISSYSISDSQLGSLRVESHGNVHGKIERSVASRGVSLNFSKMDYRMSTDEQRSSLQVDALTIVGNLGLVSDQPLDITIEDSKSTGAAYIKFDGVKGESSATTGVSSLHLHETNIGGALRVESTMPLDITGEASSAASGFLKLDGIKGESTDAVHKGTIELDSFSWGSSLSVNARVPSELSITNNRVQGETYLKYELSDVIISSYQLSNNELGGLRVESQAFVQGKVENTRSSRNARFNYLKVELDDPESAPRSSLELDQFTVTGSVLVSSSQPLDLKVDQSSAAVDFFLKLDGIKGETSSAAGDSSLTLTDTAIGGTLRVESTRPLDVSAQSSSARSGFLKFEGIKGESIDAAHKGEIHIDDFSWGTSLRVESLVPTELLLSNSKVVGDTILGFRLNDVIVSSYQLSGNELGGLRVEGSGIVQGIVESTTVGRGASFTYGKLLKEPQDEQTRSSLAVDGLTIVGSLNLIANQPLDVTLNNAKASSDSYFMLDSLSAIATGKHTTLELVDVEFVGGLRVVAGGGAESMRLERVRIGGAAQLFFGAGDDELTVIDSVFAGIALLDGGNDFDQLTLLGTTFEKTQTIRNWETPDDGSGAT